MKTMWAIDYVRACVLSIYENRTPARTQHADYNTTLCPVLLCTRFERVRVWQSEYTERVRVRQTSIEYGTHTHSVQTVSERKTHKTENMPNAEHHLSEDFQSDHPSSAVWRKKNIYI